MRRIGCPVTPEDKRSTLPVNPDTSRRVAAILAQHGLHPGRFVLLHPTSRWLYKCWLPERYAEVINALGAGGFRVVVTAAPSAEELAFVEQIMRAVTAPAVNLAGQLTLPELGAMIGQASCFLGVDSVPMHMAAAAGTPLVALFGPSSQAIWAPKGKGVTVLSSTTRACLPCLKHGCGNSGRSECLEDLTREHVLAALKPLLPVR